MGSICWVQHTDRLESIFGFAPVWLFLVMNSWRFITETGLASELHSNPTKFLDIRTLRFMKVSKPALVLGSSQDPTSFDKVAYSDLDIELAKRRSGGGAVFLEPLRQLWVDISIPKGDSLFRDDVQKSFFPIGSLFREFLSRVCNCEFEMHKGKLLGGSVGQTICFAGIGPGEITFEGAKVVGISQRRTVQGSVFQCTVYSRYPTNELALLMGSMVEPLPIPGYALGVAEIATELSLMPDPEVVSVLESELIRQFTNV